MSANSTNEPQLKINTLDAVDMYNQRGDKIKADELIEGMYYRCIYNDDIDGVEGFEIMNIYEPPFRNIDPTSGSRTLTADEIDMTLYEQACDG